MESSEHTGEQGGVSSRVLEMAVALAIVLVGALVIYDSWRMGAGWVADGPQAGYFPFYVGVLMVASGAVVFVKAALSAAPRRRFVEAQQLRSILALLVPTVVFVGLVAVVGIYVGAAVYLAYFMTVLGRFRWTVVAPVAIGVPALLFAFFEIWFLVPLPKGPLESFFGF